MKKSILILLGITAALLTACVPKDSTIINVNPDFVPAENVKYDFLQLHNDAIEGMQAIEDGGPYSFITGIDIAGDDVSKQLEIAAAAVEGVAEEDAKNYASAILCQINDAARIQNPSLEPSSRESFGSFFNEFSLSLWVEQEETGEHIYELSVPAGEAIPLDPDYEKYVEEWVRGYRVQMENVVYDVNGNIVKTD